jgi:hypothetical protein
MKNSATFAVRKGNVLLLSNCEILKETEKAILISGESNAIGVNNGRFMQGWLPKSVVNFANNTCQVLESFSKPSFEFI